MGKQQERKERSWLGRVDLGESSLGRVEIEKRWLARLDLEKFACQNWTLKCFTFKCLNWNCLTFQKEWTLKNHALMTWRWPWKFEALFDGSTLKIEIWTLDWKFDLENFALKIWLWKLDLKFDVWNLSFPIGLWKIGLWSLFHFWPLTLDLWIGLLTVDFWKFTFENWLLKCRFQKLTFAWFCMSFSTFGWRWRKQLLTPETAMIKQKQFTYCLPRLT